MWNVVLFSSPCMGILFSLVGNIERAISLSKCFRPHVWGFFFHEPISWLILTKNPVVFVPMYGDSFFTAGLGGPTGWALYGPFAAGISN